jgi:predicted acyl esterase
MTNIDGNNGLAPRKIDNVDGMIIEHDIGIKMKDGLILRADVYRPNINERVPVVMTHGPYGKGIAWSQPNNPWSIQWNAMCKERPEIFNESSCKYITWETVDPERWTAWGYAVVRVDSRGNNRSPGFLNIFSHQEVMDYYDCIEWAGTRDWSTGKVGLCGISYYAINQWQVAALQPPHLTAIIPWEGASDFYREVYRHGGILSNYFINFWYNGFVLVNQHGKGTHMDHWLGESSSGPEKLSEEELARNRAEPLDGPRNEHTNDGEHYTSRQADFSKINVPLLSCASWAGFGLHQRGNFEGFLESASKQKWLEVHPGKHEEWFYLPYGYQLQKRFFDHFLKGEENGMDREPRVLLNVRYPEEKFVQRKENEWPLKRTQWTKFYLDANSMSLNIHSPLSTSDCHFSALSDKGVVFNSSPIDQEYEITGPIAARIRVASSTKDADLFLALRAFDPDGKEITFQGTVDPRSVLSQGCLRASHRALDSEKTLPYRPYHSHLKQEFLNPGQQYDLDIEMWPTCIILSKGSTLQLVIDGKDFARQESEVIVSGPMRFAGSGCFLHNDLVDRDEKVYGGETKVITSADSWLLLPIVPKE